MVQRYLLGPKAPVRLYRTPSTISCRSMWEDAGCGSGTDRRMRPEAAPFSSFSFPFFLSFPLAGPQAGPRPANGEILLRVAPKKLLDLSAFCGFKLCDVIMVPLAQPHSSRVILFHIMNHEQHHRSPRDQRSNPKANLKPQTLNLEPW